MPKAVYAGTFDPITNGHLAVVVAVAPLFDELVIAIGENPAKKPLFSMEQRLEMLRESFKNVPHIKVDSFPYMFLVDYVSSINAQYYIRGIRDEDDYKAERKYAWVNRDFNSSIQPIWVPTPKDLSEVSSSFVKSICGIPGWESRVENLVPPAVYKALTKWQKNV